jgi:hypothetical protein
MVSPPGSSDRARQNIPAEGVSVADVADGHPNPMFKMSRLSVVLNY